MGRRKKLCGLDGRSYQSARSSIPTPFLEDEMKKGLAVVYDLFYRIVSEMQEMKDKYNKRMYPKVARSFPQKGNLLLTLSSDVRHPQQDKSQALKTKLLWKRVTGTKPPSTNSGYMILAEWLPDRKLAKKDIWKGKMWANRDLIFEYDFKRRSLNSMMEACKKSIEQVRVAVEYFQMFDGMGIDELLPYSGEKKYRIDLDGMGEGTGLVKEIPVLVTGLRNAEHVSGDEDEIEDDNEMNFVDHQEIEMDGDLELEEDFED